MENDAKEKVLDFFDQERRYGDIFEFLTHPLYKDLSATARLLYLYLRDQTKKVSVQDSERGHVDEENHIYVVSDNDELKSILNVSEPTVIKAKKELERYHLLFQKRVINEPNRLYFLKAEKKEQIPEWLRESVKG